MKLLISLFLFIPTLSAQTITFSPRDYKEGALWTVMACLPPGTASIDLPAGRIYQMMVAQGLSHDSYDQAMLDVDKKVSRSAPARIARWSGYGAAAFTFLTTTEVVRAKRQWQIGSVAAAGFLGFIVPLAQHEVDFPRAEDVKKRLLRDGDVLHVEAGRCSGGLVIGSRGRGFTVYGP